MVSKLASSFILLLITSSAVTAAPKIAQSLIVDFPVNGRVVVQTREEVGKFPEMLFTSERTHKTLLLSSIEDEEKFLLPAAEDAPEFRPSLRFRVIHSPGFKSPIIMSVGLFTGGSDNAYFLTLFTEVAGSIVRLNQKPLFANVQGGYYIGYLNKRFGYGLVAWDFVWEGGAHYDAHKYSIDIYRIEGARLKRILHTTSKKMYDSDKGARSLLELGIKVVDQRNGIPRIKDTLN
jgi:hypothetical protein